MKIRQRNQEGMARNEVNSNKETVRNEVNRVYIHLRYTRIHGICAPQHVFVNLSAYLEILVIDAWVRSSIASHSRRTWRDSALSESESHPSRVRFVFF